MEVAEALVYALLREVVDGAERAKSGADVNSSGLLPDVDGGPNPAVAPGANSSVLSTSAGRKPKVEAQEVEHTSASGQSTLPQQRQRSGIASDLPVNFDDAGAGKSWPSDNTQGKLEAILDAKLPEAAAKDIAVPEPKVSRMTDGHAVHQITQGSETISPRTLPKSSDDDSSSSSESSSTDSGSSASSGSGSQSGSDSSENDEAERRTARSQADAAALEKMLEADDADGAAPPRSRNEIDADRMDIAPLDVTITDAHNLIPFGAIKTILEKAVIIESSPSGTNTARQGVASATAAFSALDLSCASALNEDAVLCLAQSRKPFGRVFETFGPVRSPFYIVRFSSAEALNKLKPELAVGAKVSFVAELSSVVYARDLAQKGYDASNIHDEELPSGGMEYSDDEAEAAAKRARKRAARDARDATEGHAAGVHSYGDNKRRSASHGRDSGRGRGRGRGRGTRTESGYGSRHDAYQRHGQYGGSQAGSAYHNGTASHHAESTAGRGSESGLGHPMQAWAPPGAFQPPLHAAGMTSMPQPYASVQLGGAGVGSGTWVPPAGYSFMPHNVQGLQTQIPTMHYPVQTQPPANPSFLGPTEHAMAAQQMAASSHQVNPGARQAPLGGPGPFNHAVQFPPGHNGGFGVPNPWPTPNNSFVHPGSTMINGIAQVPGTFMPHNLPSASGASLMQPTVLGNVQGPAQSRPGGNSSGPPGKDM